MTKVPDNFCGLDAAYSDYAKSKAVILPIPYEFTTTYIKGTRHAPKAIIEASKYLELYDEEIDKVIAEIGIATLVPLNAHKGPQAMVEEVTKYCSKPIADGKFPLVIGGEHSISLGFLLALKEKYPDISVLQFDAHADLKNEYKGSEYNHGCVMARIRQYSDAVQVGIRSLSVEESEIIKANNYKVLWAKDKACIDSWINEILDSLSKDVFISIDVDAFDPGLIPSLGTPEPGGLSWDEVLNITRAVFRHKNVVALDIMELCPNPSNKSPDYIVAKLIYKLLGYKFFLK